MAIFVPAVAAPYLMKEIDKRLVISNAALDISADIPEIEWKGKEITFPVYSRVAVADEVEDKGSVTPTEIDGTSATAPIKHFAASVKYHKDTLRQAGGPILQNMAMTDLADAIALKLDADLMNAAITGAVLKAACAAADTITQDELEAAFALFGDKQNADEFAGMYINSRAKKNLLALEQALRPDGVIVIESTANGFNGFSDLWTKAEQGENLYAPHFYGWIDDTQAVYKLTLAVMGAVSCPRLSRLWTSWKACFLRRLTPLQRFHLTLWR